MEHSISKVKIKFYDQDTSSVEFEARNDDRELIEEELMDIFCLFYAKILFNLDKGKIADSLIEYTKKAYNDVIHGEELVRASILGSKLKLIEPISEPVIKNCVINYFKNPKGKTVVSIELDPDGEGYYAPTSTIILLQYIIFFLSTKLLILFMYEIRIMNDYYKTHNYYTEEGLNKAPSQAYAMMLLLSSRLEDDSSEK